MKYVFLTILFCLAGYGQEAYVVQLSATDSAASRAAWTNLQTAKKNWEEVQKGISQKYLIIDANDPDASDYHYVGVLIAGDLIFGSGTITSAHILTSASCLGADGKGYDCYTGKPILGPSKEELDGRRKEDEERQDRYAKEKRQRRGFGENCSTCLPKFEFSHDFRYIVPVKHEQEYTPPQLIVPGISW